MFSTSNNSLDTPETHLKRAELQTSLAKVKEEEIAQREGNRQNHQSHTQPNKKEREREGGREGERERERGRRESRKGQEQSMSHMQQRVASV